MLGTNADGIPNWLVSDFPLLVTVRVNSINFEHLQQVVLETEL